MVKNAKILIVDDEEAVRYLWSTLLRKEGFTVFETATTEQAFQIISEEKLDLVLADLKIDRRTGIDILKKTKETDSSTEVVIVTGYGSVATAVEAMHHGAFTYLTKPVDPGHLVITLQKAYERRALFLEVHELKSQLIKQYGFEHIVAESHGMRKVIELAKRVTLSDATILIQGESGTGKELIARAIHYHGNRKTFPFVAVNCAAIPETLLESELFGHVKGSFTGAVSNKVGMFEEANAGTLVLDEIADMPMSLQSKLLRVIQEGEIHRIGDNKNLPIDVRIIAITNKDLQQQVAEGKFREDLYYRLNVIKLFIPPLRERKEDILPIAHRTLEIQAKKLNKSELKLSPRAVQMMYSSPWVGNVRELENTIERASILSTDNIIDLKDLQPIYGADSAVPPSYDNKTLDEVEKEIIIFTLKKFNNNQSEVARRLGIGRNTLWRKMKIYSLNTPD